MSLEKLENSVKRMLEGEKKRREFVYQYLNKLTEILAHEDIWGTPGKLHPGDTGSIVVTRYNAEGKKISTNIYFRYVPHKGEKTDEQPGFYDSKGGYTLWGTELEDMYGANFWLSIRWVMEWVEKTVFPELKKREVRREETVKIIEKMLEVIK